MARGRGTTIPRWGRALPPFGDEFVSVEALGGLVLLAAAVGALVWANVAPGSYVDVWHHPLSIGLGDHALDLSRREWINDGLMTLFFFVVGLEIKREVVRGELRDPRTTALPVIAALGGMVLPALIYFGVNAGGAGVDGWAIPTATDIAFAVGILALLGERVPHNLKLFVLTLAIVDDIGAILVIAIFYSHGVSPAWFAGAVAAVLVIVGLQRWGAASPLVYVVPALVLWLCMEESGVHATIAGVILGLLTPARQRERAVAGGRQLIERLEHRLHPWSSFVVVPLFALANAGIVIDRQAIDRAATSPITIGVVAGLVVGKAAGISIATALGVRFRLGRPPPGVTAIQIAGAAAVAGIGFTVALFVANLSFHGVPYEDAVLGILVGSLVSGLTGALVLTLAGRRAGGTDAPESPVPSGTGD